MKYLHVFVLLGAVVFSCSKKTPQCDCEAVCKTFPETWNISNGILSPIQVSDPVFNPNNPNEFIYYSRENLNTNNSKNSLKLYNISTKESTTLIENITIFYRPSWSKLGPIGVHFVDQFDKFAVAVYHPNTQSLDVIHNDNTNYHIVWNSAGDKMIWLSQISDHKRYMLSYDILNGTIDTLFGKNEVGYLYPFSHKTVSNNDVLAYISLYPSRVRLIDLKLINDTLLSQHDYNFTDGFSGGSITAMDWANNNTSLYIYSVAKNFGLMELNPMSGEMNCILPFCCYEQIYTIASSPDGQNLLLEFNTRTNEDGMIIHSSSIELFNLATKSRTKLL